MAQHRPGFYVRPYCRCRLAPGRQQRLVRRSRVRRRLEDGQRRGDLTPVFDQQTAYSIGSVTLDPSNPETVWVGTGENVGGRHVAFGDGLYRSDDGGHSWTNMGLENSEHISKVIVHPEDSNTLWVAAQGPLWSKGGERGLFPGRALRRDVAASPHGSGLHGRWPQVGYSPLPRWWPQLAEARERPSRWQYRQDR